MQSAAPPYNEVSVFNVPGDGSPTTQDLYLEHKIQLGSVDC